MFLCNLLQPSIVPRRRFALTVSLLGPALTPDCTSTLHDFAFNPISILADTVLRVSIGGSRPPRNICHSDLANMSTTKSRQKQIIDARYISEAKLVQLLKDLFQNDYSLEVSRQLLCLFHSLHFISDWKLTSKVDDGDYVVSVPRVVREASLEKTSEGVILR